MKQSNEIIELTKMNLEANTKKDLTKDELYLFKNYWKNQKKYLLKSSIVPLSIRLNISVMTGTIYFIFN
jgi:hypothetical protein